MENSEPNLRAALRLGLLRGIENGRNPLDLIAGLSSDGVEELLGNWQVNARDDQWPPDGDWLVWLLLGGRGAGKTRAGAEWVHGMALGEPPFATRPAGHIALVGETFADVREVMIEGVSGLLHLHPADKRPAWTPSRRRIEWENGAVAHAFSSEDPEALRGPQFSAAWSDELGKWRYPDACWDMLQFGLRLGERPRQVVTTTPRPIPLLRRLLSAPDTIVTRAATVANRFNLAPGLLVYRRFGIDLTGTEEFLIEILASMATAIAVYAFPNTPGLGGGETEP